MQLVDGDDYDFKTGKVTFAAPFDRPYDWTKAGKTALFDSMLTPAGLAEIKKYADGVGPWKPYIVPVKGSFDAVGKMLLKFDTQSSISQIFLANSSMNSSICIGFLVEMEKSS